MKRRDGEGEGEEGEELEQLDYRIPTIRARAVDINTPKVLERLSEKLYGGVYPVHGWEPEPGDKYHRAYLNGSYI